MPTPEPRRVAIVGAGPAGLYAAAALVADPGVRVDIFDRLPTPFGLLRYGVAPDHASIKAVATTLARVFESDRVRFLGLVEFGRDVTAAELVAAYDAVIYAVGAADDRHLGIPGEDLPGSRSARQFVAWYSGHPDAEPQPMAGVRDAVVIGVGNVAVDVARILLKEPAALSATDMPDAVLAALREADIQRVWLVGRRGPEHATFTTPELRELLETPGIGITLTGCDLDAIDDTVLERHARANVAAIARAVAASPATADRWLHLLFWHRPAALDGEGRVQAVRFEPTVPAAVPEESVSPTERHEGGVLSLSKGPITVPADLVLRSIGYRGVPLPGVPYDEGRIPNLEGRVLELDGSARPGEYAVGWIKRGPVGLIGSNKKDAAETVAHLLEDLATQPHRHLTDLDTALAARGVRPSDLADWRRIDEAEIDRGSIRGSERTKIEAWHDLLDLVRRDAGPA
ncbi:MAG TPA: FAD-dependent oxidoreductase [Propionicimonas sp.]|nr:FAD-dependent oxidoreductase [Propionicimonas sp.]